MPSRDTALAVARCVYVSAQSVLLMYATAQNRLERRVILQTVMLRAKAIVQSVGARSDKRSVDYVDAYLDEEGKQMNKMNKFESRSGFVPWLLALLLSAVAAGCGGGGGGVLGGGDTGAAAPTVTAVAPLRSATGVPINTKIVTAAFSKAMDAATLTTASFTLACGAAQAGSVGYASLGNVATLTLTANLPASTTCTATITTAAKDSGGVALASTFTWTFTTGAAPDTTAPTVSSTFPLANATGVAVNAHITASFSEAMDPLTTTTATVGLACPTGTAITGSVGYAVNGNVATFIPASSLPASTTCTATITTGVKDVAGNAMASAFTWTFTTGAAPDTTAPTVISTVPLANATGVAVNALITANFSEAMDPLTITNANFTLACPTGTAVTGTVGYAVNGNVATFTPTGGNLSANTTCTATIGTGVKDVAGNALASAFSWSFTTGAALDVTAPTVSSTFPLANATGVAVNAHITASFSEPMDPLTISTATISLACPTGTAITGTVGYAGVGNVATFTPTGGNLPANTTCRATITTGVKDVAGNALATTFSWTFTTGAALDTTAPTVSSTFPLANAGSVAFNTLVTATFSEAMDPLTITLAPSNMRLACPTGTAVTGTVGYAVNGNVATFTPSSNLPASTTCTATITTGVKDVAGNAMASTFTWNFSTGAAPDNVAPTVSSTFPLANSTGVAVNTPVTADFNEAMNPLTITSDTIKLACPTGSAIVGNVGFAQNSNVVTFTPLGDLPSSTTCTATITTGVRDVSGNPLANTFNWSFTTAASALDLASAANYGAIASSTITNAAFATVISADVGLSPNPAGLAAITGFFQTDFGPGNITGSIRVGNGVSLAGLARADAAAAYQVAKTAGAAPGFTTVSGNIGGTSPPPGVYHSTSSIAINGSALTLSSEDANAVWIFDMESTLTTTPGGTIVMAGAAQASNVFWRVGSSAVLGAAIFKGTILANTSITLGTVGIAVEGRLLASLVNDGAVNFNDAAHSVTLP